MTRLGLAAVLFVALGTPVLAFEWGNLLGNDEEARGADHPWQVGIGPASDDEIRAVGIGLEIAEMMRNRTGGAARLYRIAGVDTPLGLVWSIDAPSAAPLVQNLREELLRQKLVVFVATRRFGTGLDEIGIVGVESPEALLAKLGTGGKEVDKAGVALLTQLRSWSSAPGWDLVGAGKDWIEIEFRTPPADADRLLEEAGRLAPAAIGPDDERAHVRDELVKNRRLSLWWDAP